MSMGFRFLLFKHIYLLYGLFLPLPYFCAAASAELRTGG
jgi:hypothetical protein